MNSSENQAIHTLAIRATNAFRFFADNILGTDSNPRIERRFLKPIVEVQNSRLWFNRRKFHSRAHAPPIPANLATETAVIGMGTNHPNTDKILPLYNANDSMNSDESRACFTRKVMFTRLSAYK